MTRRTLMLAVLLCTAGATAACAGNDSLDRGIGANPAPSLPSLSAPGGADIGVADPPAGGAEDGALGDRTVSVDSDEAAVSRLDPELLTALRDAAAEALDDGIEVRVTSGWRSRDYQQQLLDEAIAKYGSRQEALRWVATPDESAHTTGAAVDVGPTDAAYWMSEHGSEFGLCQAYANEIWHYELLTSPGGTCPTPRVDGNS